MATNWFVITVCTNGYDVFVGYDSYRMFVITCEHKPYGTKYDSRYEYLIRVLGGLVCGTAVILGLGLVDSFNEPRGNKS